MEMVEVARFRGPAVSGSELQKAVEAAMAQLAEDPAARAELAESGLDETSMRETVIHVEQQPGLDPASVVVTILVSASSQLAANAVQALWEDVMRRVRKRKGFDAFGEPLDR